MRKKRSHLFFEDGFAALGLAGGTIKLLFEACSTFLLAACLGG
jgi:hypothetical protein